MMRYTAKPATKLAVKDEEILSSDADALTTGQLCITDEVIPPEHAMKILFPHKLAEAACLIEEDPTGS